jgi:hypothetical protein
MRSDNRNAPPAALMSVYSGRECLGFIISRGKAGYEAFDPGDRSLGLYATQKLAADALSEQQQGGER